MYNSSQFLRHRMRVPISVCIGQYRAMYPKLRIRERGAKFSSTHEREAEKAANCIYRLTCRQMKIGTPAGNPTHAHHPSCTFSSLASPPTSWPTVPFRGDCHVGKGVMQKKQTRRPSP